MAQRLGAPGSGKAQRFAAPLGPRAMGVGLGGWEYTPREEGFTPPPTPTLKAPPVLKKNLNYLGIILDIFRMSWTLLGPS